jgi:hypothetical protein
MRDGTSLRAIILPWLAKRGNPLPPGSGLLRFARNDILDRPKKEKSMADASIQEMWEINMRIKGQGNTGRQVSRRNVLQVMAGSGAAMMAGEVKTSGRERAAGAGRIKQSIAYWCVQKYWSIERTCQVARDLGCKSVELVEPKDWPTLKKYGLVCAIANSHWFDKGMNNPQYHEMCLGKLREAIAACADAGFPNVITFTGLAEDISPEEGLKNCVAGYKKIMGYA